MWRKSSYCGANGTCVEVAAFSGMVGIRDSKNPIKPPIRLEPKQFETLLIVLKRNS